MFGRMMVSALALTGAAYAQEAPADASASSDCAPTPTCATATPGSSADRVAYDAAFFAQYSPRTALDMVRQTPGFTLNGGDERRGFSGAVGNVLIDGVRPTSKSQSLDGQLSRIPAGQIVRLEVLRGPAVAGDASGQAVLLNVVRTASAGSGIWSAGIENNVDRLAPQGELSYTGRNGQVEYGLGADIYSQYRLQEGGRRLTDAVGALTETADTPSPRNFRQATLNGNLAFPLLGGRLSSTAQVHAWRYHSDNGFFFQDPVGVSTRSQTSHYTEQGRDFELGLNFDRDIGPWSLGLVGLVNGDRYQSDEFVTNFDGLGTQTSEITQGQVQITRESILRGTLSRALTQTQRIEFGAEGAFNSLDQTLDLTGNPPLGPIPNSNVLVEEKRAEFFGVHTWRPNDLWTLETRLAWETSTLTFTGDTNQSVELSFWKPSVQLSRTFAGNNQLRFRVYRDVGQLDFGDFTSAASISDELISGGNPDLVPQTDWRAELGADLRFPGGAALSLTLTQHNYRDVADVVLITIPNPPDPDILFDAPGNIGDGKATSLEVNFSTPLSAFIPGGRLTIEGSLWDTEVTDPVTSRPRIISNIPESSVDIEFRQDLNAQHLAWGLSLHKEGETQAYRFNEIDTQEEGPWVDMFVETTALPNDMKLRATLANVAHGTIDRDRRFFEASDRNGPFTRRDLRQRDFGYAPWLILELSGAF